MKMNEMMNVIDDMNSKLDSIVQQSRSLQNDLMDLRYSIKTMNPSESDEDDNQWDNTRQILQSILDKREESIVTPDEDDSPYYTLQRKLGNMIFRKIVCGRNFYACRDDDNLVRFYRYGRFKSEYTIENVRFMEHIDRQFLIITHDSFIIIGDNDEKIIPDIIDQNQMDIMIDNIRSLFHYDNEFVLKLRFNHKFVYFSSENGVDWWLSDMVHSNPNYSVGVKYCQLINSKEYLVMDGDESVTRQIPIDCKIAYFASDGDVLVCMGYPSNLVGITSDGIHWDVMELNGIGNSPIASLGYSNKHIIVSYCDETTYDINIFNIEDDEDDDDDWWDDDEDDEEDDEMTGTVNKILKGMINYLEDDEDDDEDVHFDHPHLCMTPISEQRYTRICCGKNIWMGISDDGNLYIHEWMYNKPLYQISDIRYIEYSDGRFVVITDNKILVVMDDTDIVIIPSKNSFSPHTTVSIVVHRDDFVVKTRWHGVDRWYCSTDGIRWIKCDSKFKTYRASNEYFEFNEHCYFKMGCNYPILSPLYPNDNTFIGSDGSQLVITSYPSDSICISDDGENWSTYIIDDMPISPIADMAYNSGRIVISFIDDGTYMIDIATHLNSAGDQPIDEL